MRLEQADFVIFLDADWGATTQRNRQHFLIAELARQLAGRSRLLAVERPVCPWTGPVRTRQKYIEWLRGRRGLRQAAPNLFLYTPAVLLHNVIAARIPGLTALNRRLVQALLGRVLKRLSFRTDRLVAWIHHPYQLEDAGLVGERLLVYDCYDDYLSQARGRRLADLQRREAAILRRADLVLAASERLREALQGRARQVHLVPNGVEFEHFVQAVPGEPSPIWQDARPVLGFTGKITPRLDFALLARLAASHPDWSLVLIGPQEHSAELSRDSAYQEFVAAPNVHLAGPRPYQELPAQMRMFNVCLLPYTASDPFNAACSPLKLYEYLATGKPIVATDIPAVRPFDGLVRIARGADEFERQVAAALEERDDTLRAQRLAAARQNSWTRRAEQVIALIEAALEVG